GPVVERENFAPEALRISRPTVAAQSGDLSPQGPDLVIDVFHVVASVVLGRACQAVGLCIKTGANEWLRRVDIVWTFPNGETKRISEKSPVQTRRGAEEYERGRRAELAAGEPARREEETPTVREFAEMFMTTHAKVENKPSEIRAKEIMLRQHLLPQLGDL